jgi:hypothetical protein
MKAFIEITSGIIRVGPDTDAYLKPFEAAAAFVADGGNAKIKGLVGGLTIRQARAALIALETLGLKPVWERVPK